MPAPSPFNANTTYDANTTYRELLLAIRKKVWQDKHKGDVARISPTSGETGL